MQRFWNEIQEHRIASGLFLIYWALAYLLDIFRWHAPKDTSDIVPPVLLLHALVPFVAGVLAAWWRGPHPGRILDGMLAGAVVTLADFVLIFLHDALKFQTGNSQGGEGIMEVPAWLAVVSLIGAVLGCAGAGAGAAFGGRVAPAERCRTAKLPRGIVRTASALAFSVAVAIAVVVIPPVGGDTSPGATPDRAVPAFSIMAVLNVYAGVAFLIAQSPKTGPASRPIAAITGLLLIAMGAMLAAAGSAGIGRPHMEAAAAGSIVSALGDVAAGALAFGAVFGKTRIQLPFRASHDGGPRPSGEC